jgi:tripartite-type tricarboxylate transporter receptor subunit TctC
VSGSFNGRIEAVLHQSVPSSEASNPIQLPIELHGNYSDCKESFKMKVKFCTAALLAIATSFTCWSPETMAQDYPRKPLTLVTPYGAGGATDVFARLLAGSLEKEFKQPIIVENKPGIGGVLGADAVAKATPDGYTLLMGSTFIPSLRIFMKNPPFDPNKDLAPVSLLIDGELMLSTPADAQWNNLKEMVAYAKANPGKLNYGSTGSGEPVLHSEAIKREFGINIVHVPYKSGADYSMAVVKGEVQLGWPAPFRAQADVKAGKVKVLAVTGPRRIPQFPDTPTFQELGLKGIDNYWFGLFAPGKTPRPIIDRLHGGVVTAMKDPKVRENLEKAGFNPVASTPEYLAQRIVDMEKNWTALAKAVGLEPQQ